MIRLGTPSADSKLQIMIHLIFTLLADNAFMNGTCERFPCSNLQLRFFHVSRTLTVEHFCNAMWMIKSATSCQKPHGKTWKSIVRCRNLNNSETNPITVVTVHNKAKKVVGIDTQLCHMTPLALEMSWIPHPWFGQEFSKRVNISSLPSNVRAHSYSKSWTWSPNR